MDSRSNAVRRSAVQIKTYSEKGSTEEGTATIPAYALGDGLTVHQMWEGGKLIKGSWTVTHERSGLRIGSYFPNRDAAMQFAADCRGLTDWTQPAASLLEQPRLNEQVRVLITKHRGLAWYPEYHVGLPTDIDSKGK